MSEELFFSAGKNIAMKVPSQDFENTVNFYRNVLMFKEINENAPSVCFEFGGNVLWIDNVPGMSQAEIWLEIITNDIQKASEYLKENQIVRCDEIEPLPDGLQAFWISSPSSIIHLVSKDTESW